MAGKARSAENRELYARIGEFLNDHRLDPTPANYALVYELFANDASAAALAVRQATSDGLRLTEAEAGRILSEYGLQLSTEGVTGGESAALAAIRRQVSDFASVVDATRIEAQRYGRDLADAAAELEAEDQQGSVSGLVRITGAMLERTRQAERQLAQAREEAQSLRAQLAEAEEEARSDALTELPNRRAFEDKLAEVQAAHRPHSIGLCDIDHFKAINDTHGHNVGDRVLKMVASVLQESCGGHLVARIGGEEFVVLFEGLAPSAAAELLNQARDALGRRNFRVRETDEPLGRISFSAGVAWSDGGRDGDTTLQRADELLYDAKHSGRNQVRGEGIATDPHPVLTAC